MFKLYLISILMAFEGIIDWHLHLEQVVFRAN